MGLLDFLSTDEGRLGLGLLAAAGPRRDGMGTGGRIQEALNGVDARKRAQAEDEWRKMQMEEQRAQIAQRAQAQEQARFNKEAIRQQFSPMEGGASMSNGQGPTLGNAQNLGQMQPFDPRTFFAKNPQADVSALKQAMEINGAMNPARKFETVAAGSSVYEMGPDGPRLATTAPSAPKEKNPNQPFMLGENGEFVPNLAYQEYQ